MQHKKQIQMAAFVLVSLASVVGVQQGLSYAQDRQNQREIPLRSTGDGVPDAAKVGNISAAMSQCRHLMTLLKEANWDGDRIPLSALQLPDRKFAEDRAYAAALTSSFIITRQKSLAPTVPASDPKLNDLAFYTPIYFRRNSSYYKGDKMRSQPTGFFIVGLKNGNVFQVPVADVRVIRGRTQPVVRVFPGMKAYDPNALRLPEVELSTAMTPARRAAFNRLMAVDDCPTCPK